MRGAVIRWSGPLEELLVEQTRGLTTRCCFSPIEFIPFINSCPEPHQWGSKPAGARAPATWRDSQMRKELRGGGAALFNSPWLPTAFCFLLQIRLRHIHNNSHMCIFFKARSMLSGNELALQYMRYCLLLSLLYAVLLSLLREVNKHGTLRPSSRWRWMRGEEAGWHVAQLTFFIQRVDLRLLLDPC